MKDNFSNQPDQYAKYRPTYPDSLFDYILSLVNRNDNVWDCGTGNGQVAGKLAQYFKQVYATDISQAQLNHAVQQSNIQYSVQPTEQTNFQDRLFDLIIVSQAIHWFNFDEFYREVSRTLRDDGYLVVVGYNLLQLSADLDAVIYHFYTQIIGKYWDKERTYLDEKYQTIPFPFHEIPSPEFVIQLEWTFEHLIGYLKTWSAVKHFQEQQGFNPIEQIKDELQKAWGHEDYRQVGFPVLLRVGKKS